MRKSIQEFSTPFSNTDQHKQNNSDCHDTPTISNFKPLVNTCEIGLTAKESWFLSAFFFESLGVSKKLFPATLNAKISLVKFLLRIWLHNLSYLLERSIDDVVQLTIIKAGKALKFFVFVCFFSLGLWREVIANPQIRIWQILPPFLVFVICSWAYFASISGKPRVFKNVFILMRDATPCSHTLIQNWSIWERTISAISANGIVSQQWNQL